MVKGNIEGCGAVRGRPTVGRGKNAVIFQQNLRNTAKIVKTPLKGRRPAAKKYASPTQCTINRLSTRNQSPEVYIVLSVITLSLEGEQREHPPLPSGNPGANVFFRQFPGVPEPGLTVLQKTVFSVNAFPSLFDFAY